MPNLGKLEGAGAVDVAARTSGQGADPLVIRRDRPLRSVVDLFSAGGFADVVDGFGPGGEIFGMSKGQWALASVAEWGLAMTGPASLVISTWATTGREMEKTIELMESDAVTSAVWVVDKSFRQRQATYHKRLVDMFGEGAVVEARCHMKVVAIKNERWNLVVRTSANMSPILQAETFDIADSAELMGMVEAFLAEVAGGPVVPATRIMAPAIMPRICYGAASEGKAIEWFDVGGGA